MAVPRELAVCALRLSMGRTTTAAEVGTVVAALAECARVAAGAAAAGSRASSAPDPTTAGPGAR